MTLNFLLHPTVFIIVLIYNIRNVLSGPFQDQTNLEMPDWRRQLIAQRHNYPYGLYGSIDYVNPMLNDQKRKTSIIYLDTTAPSGKKQFISVEEKSYTVKKKRRKKKNKRRNGGDLNNENTTKKKKKKNRKQKGKKKEQVKGWTTFRQTKTDSSGLSDEAKKRKPVDIIVHIKMKDQ